MQHPLAALKLVGRQFHHHVAAINRRAEQPVGKLTITTNASNSERPYSEPYVGFVRAYPKVQLTLH